MFCYQCEQTDRTPQPGRPNLLSFGCSSDKGNCGKDATTAALQDVLVHVDLGIGQYAQKLRELSAPDPQYAAHASFDLFTTLTNVNFNATRFMSLISEAVAVRDRAKQAYEAAAHAAGKEPETLTGQAQFEPAAKISEVVAQSAAVGVDADLDTLGADIIGLRNLNLYGLRGVCAYPTTRMPWATAPRTPMQASRAAWRSWRPDRRTSTRCWATPSNSAPSTSR